MARSSLTQGTVEAVETAVLGVDTAGQARAVIDESSRFAKSVAIEVRATESFWAIDGWKESFAKQLTDAAGDVDKLKDIYSEGSDVPINRMAWIDHGAKCMYPYILAKNVYEGFPEDQDATTIFDLIVGAPGAMLDAVTDAGKAIVRSAGEITKEALTQAKEAVDAAIPWTPILLGVGLLALGVVGVVYMSKSGALKDVKGIVR